LKSTFLAVPLGIFKPTDMRKRIGKGVIHKKYAKFEYRFLNYPSLSRLYDAWCRKPESLKRRFSQKVTKKEQPTALIM